MKANLEKCSTQFLINLYNSQLVIAETDRAKIRAILAKRCLENAELRENWKEILTGHIEKLRGSH